MARRKEGRILRNLLDQLDLVYEDYPDDNSLIVPYVIDGDALVEIEAR